MKFTRESPATLTIRSVADGQIRIGNDVFDHTIAVTTDRIIDNIPDKPIGMLAEDDFSGLLESNPELIVLGTGTKNVFPPRDLVFALARRGIGLEVMDTAAAARTFNVLASEGRQVAALLYP